MRVTKLIKEYVEREIKARIPKSAEEVAWETERERMNEAITEGNERIEALEKEVAKELNLKYGFTKDYCLIPKKHYSTITDKYYGDSEIYKAYCKAKREREEKIFKAIEEILLTLELGGTKTELEEMLAKVGQ